MQADDATTRMMRYDAGKKSVGVAYLLWFFLGALGVHRFYLGSWGVGLLLLACTVFSVLTLHLSLLVTGAILVWDLFTIPGKVHRHTSS